MTKNIYYHNPRCSKSRQGLTILAEQGIDFTTKEYLTEKLTSAELTELFLKLTGDPRKAIRTKEKIYEELGLKDKNIAPSEWVQILIEHPLLLERPILVTEKRTIIGRPPENFLLNIDL